jgi:excisionase family DNA binding protein
MTTTDTSPGLLLKTPEAARALCISERTLWALTQPRGPIPVVRFGRSIRYSRDALVAWIASAELRPAGENGEPRESGPTDGDDGRAMT